MGWSGPRTVDRPLGGRSQRGRPHTQKRRRTRGNISHLSATWREFLRQPKKRRSPMKIGIGILLAVLAMCALAWAFLELREGGYLSSYAAQPESPAPPQTAGASFAYSFDN